MLHALKIGIAFGIGTAIARFEISKFDPDKVIRKGPPKALPLAIGYQPTTISV
jgi:hypothetical protein